MKTTSFAVLRALSEHAEACSEYRALAALGIRVGAKTERVAQTRSVLELLGSARVGNRDRPSRKMRLLRLRAQRAASMTPYYM